MKTRSAGERHRAHHSRAAVQTGVALVALLAGVAACGSGVPRPPPAVPSVEDYVAVPFAPRAPPVEFIPPRPVSGAVWVDGSWEWSGGRYVWAFGSWMLPPSGALRARWVVVRRDADGQMFFAPARWRGADGKPIDDRAWASLLGPGARASSRPIGGRGGTVERGRQRERERIVTPPPGDEEDE